MGEYAKYRGDTIKIGTCEELLYLRWDQRELVTPLPGSVDPRLDSSSLRFRFPWPDEDGVAPGAFSGRRSWPVPEMAPPPEITHGMVQLAASVPSGYYLMSIPCPEGLQTDEIATINGKHVHVHHNGWTGSVRLESQRWADGLGLVPVLSCGGCGAAWSLRDVDEIKALADAYRTSGQGVVADRILNGIGEPQETR